MRITNNNPPIDLPTIQDKLEAVRTRSTPTSTLSPYTAPYTGYVHEFVSDLIQIVLNAMRFNPPGHKIHELAVELGEKIMLRHIPYLRRLCYVHPDEIVCWMCGDASSVGTNKMVTCDQCGLWYHQLCVDVDVLPAGGWHCYSCVSTNPKIAKLKRGILPYDMDEPRPPKGYFSPSPRISSIDPLPPSPSPSLSHSLALLKSAITPHPPFASINDNNILHTINVPRTPAGLPQLPLSLEGGTLVLKKLGSMERTTPAYHTRSLLFPVRYVAQRILDGSTYVCSIARGVNDPEFVITCNKHTSRSSSIRGAWYQLLVDLQHTPTRNALITKLDESDALAMFGLSNATVLSLLQDLPGISMCTAYVMRKAVVDEPPRPSAITVNGSNAPTVPALSTRLYTHSTCPNTQLRELSVKSAVGEISTREVTMQLDTIETRASMEKERVKGKEKEKEEDVLAKNDDAMQDIPTYPCPRSPLTPTNAIAPTITIISNSGSLPSPPPSPSSLPSTSLPPPNYTHTSIDSDESTLRPAVARLDGGSEREKSKEGAKEKGKDDKHNRKKRSPTPLQAATTKRKKYDCTTSNVTSSSVDESTTIVPSTITASSAQYNGMPLESEFPLMRSDVARAATYIDIIGRQLARAQKKYEERDKEFRKERQRWKEIEKQLINKAGVTAEQIRAFFAPPTSTVPPGIDIPRLLDTMTEQEKVIQQFTGERATTKREHQCALAAVNERLVKCNEQLVQERIRVNEYATKLSEFGAYFTMAKKHMKICPFAHPSSASTAQRTTSDSPLLGHSAGTFTVPLGQSVLQASARATYGSTTSISRDGYMKRTRNDHSQNAVLQPSQQTLQHQYQPHKKQSQHLKSSLPASPPSSVAFQSSKAKTISNSMPVDGSTHTPVNGMMSGHSIVPSISTAMPSNQSGGNNSATYLDPSTTSYTHRAVQQYQITTHDSAMGNVSVAMPSSRPSSAH